MTVSTSTSSSSSNNLTLDKFGGQSSFEYVVYRMVECIQDDSKLYKSYFVTFDQESMFMMFNNLLKTMIFSEDDSESDVTDYMLLRFYRLMKIGFNTSDYDQLMKHFRSAMEDGWIDNNVMDDAISTMKKYRCVFDNDDNDDKAVVPTTTRNNHSNSLLRTILSTSIITTANTAKTADSSSSDDEMMSTPPPTADTIDIISSVEQLLL